MRRTLRRWSGLLTILTKHDIHVSQMNLMAEIRRLHRQLDTASLILNESDGVLVRNLRGIIHRAQKALRTREWHECTDARGHTFDEASAQPAQPAQLDLRRCGVCGGQPDPDRKSMEMEREYVRLAETKCACGHVRRRHLWLEQCEECSCREFKEPVP